MKTMAIWTLSKWIAELLLTLCGTKVARDKCLMCCMSCLEITIPDSWALTLITRCWKSFAHDGHMSMRVGDSLWHNEKTVERKMKNISNYTKNLKLHLSIPLSFIPWEEVEAAVKSLKKGKSAGVDNIPSELVQAGGEAMIDMLLIICNKIWQTGEWPTPWTQSLIITLPRKATYNYAKTTVPSARSVIQVRSC